MKLAHYFNTTIVIDNLDDFLHSCVSYLGFHPDSSFEDYIVFSSGNQCFTEEQCNQLNARLDEAFEVCDKHGICIYERTNELNDHLV